MSCGINNNYENLLHLYRAIRTFSSEETRAQLATLPQEFREQIIYQLTQINTVLHLDVEEWEKIETFDKFSIASLQHAIQKVASLGIHILLRQNDDSLNDERINWLCKQGVAKNLTEAHLICLHEYGQDKELETILNVWVEHAEPGEGREKAKEMILAFRGDPFQRILNLCRLNLKILPPIFDRFPFVDQLLILRLSNNGLKTLPPEIGHLHNLSFLHLDGNQLTELPEQICELKQLATLNLKGNDLLGLPENIAHLSRLKRLVASCNPLTDYPRGIFRLPQDCQVDFSQTFLSDRDIEEIEDSPYILYSQSTEESLFELNQFLRNHFPDPNLTLSHFPDLVNHPKTHRILREWPQEISPNKHHVLTEWLRRVSWSRDYEQSCPKIIDCVASAMQLAQTNLLYREKFWEIVEEATTDCADRGALSVLRLGRWKRVMNANTHDIKEFAKVIASFWPLEMLDRIASHKIEQLKTDHPTFKEDTQVFLEYPLKLKAQLELNIDVDSNYFSSESGVTQDDLNQAEAFVKKLEQNQREKCRFLFNEKLWFDAFTQAYPEEVKGIEEYIGWKTDKLDGNKNSTKEDYDELLSLREEIFIALIASKLSLEIPEQPLEEIVDWETELHSTFGIAENVSDTSSCSDEEDSSLSSDESDVDVASLIESEIHFFEMTQAFLNNFTEADAEELRQAIAAFDRSQQGSSENP